LNISVLKWIQRSKIGVPTAKEITPQIKDTSIKQKITMEIIAKNRNRSK